MAADIIIHNGALITFDEAQGDALAIEGGKIVAVGGAELMMLKGLETRVIDAAGGTVLPGFIDSHVHLFGGSVELDCLNLYGVKGAEALREAVLPYAAANPDDPLVFCVMADYDALGLARTLTRHDLDAILADRPLAMYAADHHTMWVNTAALDLVGLL